MTVFRKTLQLKACQATKGKKILLVHLFLFQREIIKYMATKLFNLFKDSFCLLWK